MYLSEGRILFVPVPGTMRFKGMVTIGKLKAYRSSSLSMGVFLSRQLSQNFRHIPFPVQ